MDAGTKLRWLPHLPWVLETPDGRVIEGDGPDGRDARRFASSGDALAFSAAQGEPWRSGCVARNVETGEVNAPARLAVNGGAGAGPGGGA